jgi:GNAT superfamily N-acetyltransferase
METIEIFLPPQGWLFIAFDDVAPAGCACARQLDDSIAELKRMYVRPNHRRRGIGRLLVDATVRAVRQSNYSFLRLDSAGFMSEAHSLSVIRFRGPAAYDGREVRLNIASIGCSWS